ncbi:OmpA family protein [Rapidithrix thailandica]|uniref:OmpA family protein n=1 Tax=Rapidithrix thailandica TaxID=413964 RepID=A0AAW9S3S2_9BACT
MKTPFFTLLLISFTWLTAEAQFHTRSKKAVKLFEAAVEAKKTRNFDKAKELLQKAIKTDDTFSDAYFALGNIHELYREGNQAREYYQQTVKLSPAESRFLHAWYFLAQDAMASGRYQEAKELAGKYLNSNSPRKRKRLVNELNLLMKNVEYALEAVNHPIPFDPVSLNSKVNRLSEQSFPVITADKQTLIFTGLSELGDENVYECKFENGDWTEPIPLKDINSAINEGTCSISADGKTMIITSCDGNRSRKNYGQCDLYICKKVGDTWSKMVNLGPAVNSRNWDSQPSLSADGRKLFFTSDRPGGVGGRDIWMSTLQENGQWSQAINLGPEINTPHDEISPFIHVNGLSLFFASNGHLGMGGFDLYKAEFVNSEWEMPENLGYPLNDHTHQLSLFITSDGQTAYFSRQYRDESDNVRSKLLSFEVPAQIKPQKVSRYVKGKVYDASTKQSLAAKIDLIDIETEEILSTVESDAENGEYLIVLNEGAEYALYVNRPGYLFKSLRFDLQADKTHESKELDVPLDPLKKGSKVRLNNIFFESDSYTLLGKSKTELEKLVKFMKENPSVKIQVGAHTDSDGSEKYNQDLSLNRAKAVVEYLSQKGIASEQISSIGYGESEPLVPNDSDENKAQNRRIEFEIL